MSADTTERTNHTSPRRLGEGIEQVPRHAPEAVDRALEAGYRTLRTGAIGPRAAPTSAGDRRHAATTVHARTMPRSGERFELMHTELERHGDTVVVVAYGEIDLSCAPRLEARLRGLLGCARRLVLDLSGVRFMDSSGLHCVLDVHHASRAAGVEFTLLPGPPQVQRIFRITKTDEIVRFVAVRPARRLAPKGSLR